MDAEEIKKNMQDGINALRKEIEQTTDERLKAAYEERVKALETAHEQVAKDFEAMRRNGGGFGGVSVPGAESVKFSISAALKGHLYGDWRGAEAEQEVIKAAREQYAKTMNSSVDTAGGFILPIETSASIIESLEAESVVLRAGARRVNVSGNSFSVPTEKGGITAYWIGENDTMTESELKFGELNVVPKKLSALVPISGRMLRIGGPTVDALVARKLATRLDQALDIALLTGNTPDRPRGVVHTTGVSTYAMGTNGGRVRLDTLAKIDDVLAAANVPLTNISQVTRREVITGIRTERVPTFSGGTAETGAMPVFPMMTEQGMASMIGPYFTTTQLSKTLVKGNKSDCTYFIRGDWSALNVLFWGGLMLDRSEHVKFVNDIVLIRGMMEVNSYLDQPERLCVVSDARVAD